MITVNASDGTHMATPHEVTVTVTNVNEVPSIAGDATIEYAENDTRDVATYMVAGPNAASITWSLEGADAGDFDISNGGVLRFSNSPDYETPTDDGTDNTYLVTVKASDGTNMASHEVTVTVTNVDDTTVGEDLLDRYDADDSGHIDLGEAVDAVLDYQDGNLSLSDAVDVILLYHDGAQ